MKLFLTSLKAFSLIKEEATISDPITFSNSVLSVITIHKTLIKLLQTLSEANQSHLGKLSTFQSCLGNEIPPKTPSGKHPQIIFDISTQKKTRSAGETLPMFRVGLNDQICPKHQTLQQVKVFFYRGRENKQKENH